MMLTPQDDEDIAPANRFEVSRIRRARVLIARACA